MSFVQEMQLLDFTGPTRAIDLLAWRQCGQDTWEIQIPKGSRLVGEGILELMATRRSLPTEEMSLTSIVQSALPLITFNFPTSEDRELRGEKEGYL